MRAFVVVSAVLAVACAAQAAPRGLVPLLFAEPKGDAKAGAGLPLVAPLAAKDARVREATKLADNEAARFIRKVIARVAGGRLPDGLTVVLKPGGNHAKVGYTLERGGKTDARASEPFVLLELRPERLSHTLLHEGGHVVHALARGDAQRKTPWTPIYHSTFAVTEPATALAEGYAIHLEALWGHFGSDRERRAFYHHERLTGEPPDPVADAFLPVRDLLSFSQNHARYAAVRDGLPAFCGADEADYLRAQYDPGRDRARLKGPQAMIASEGVVASVFFWTVATRAMAAGAKPGAGLDQPALLAAEIELVNALTAAEKAAGGEGAFRPDLIDVVSAPGPARAVALGAFLAQTRGVTAAPRLAAEWTRAWRGALTMDIASAKDASELLSKALADLSKKAEADPKLLRAAVGPVLPVRAPSVKLELKALGEPFPLEFDLNALSSAELAKLQVTPAQRLKLDSERARAPFSTIADFESRTGVKLSALGLEPVKLD
jgi:hypothetical protein